MYEQCVLHFVQAVHITNLENIPLKRPSSLTPMLNIDEMAGKIIFFLINYIGDIIFATPVAAINNTISNTAFVSC